MPGPEIANFGGNVRFRPRSFHEPADEAELLEILRQNRAGTIRVVASRHAWSPSIETEDVLVDMRRFDHVRVEEREGGPVAVVGAGCRLKRLLRELDRRGLTLPAVGLITEQTIAGATSTGTHGSGRHSLSHYVAAARIACFRGGDPTIVEVADGDELRAARCSLGCLGIVVEVVLPCVPQYHVEEEWRFGPLDEMPVGEDEWPLQQFFLFPHSWRFAAQRRRVSRRTTRSWSAPLHRAYWFVGIDLALHVLVKVAAAWLRSRRLVRLLFRRVVPQAVPRWRVVDRSDRQLVMEHELFRHLELEAFVPDVRMVDAGRFVVEVLRQADGAGGTLEETWRVGLAAAGLAAEFDRLRGTFTHHYVVCFRRVLRDETLISMTSGGSPAWYAISFITYREPRDDFYRLATFLARSLHVLFGARLHWGKWFPLAAAEVAAGYPDIDRFREIARAFDPRGVFQNDFTRRVLGFSSDAAPRPTSPRSP